MLGSVDGCGGKLSRISGLSAPVAYLLEVYNLLNTLVFIGIRPSILKGITLGVIKSCR